MITSSSSMDMHTHGLVFQTHGEELRRRMARQAPPLWILDLRPRPDYDRGRIPGALSARLADLEVALPAGAAPGHELVVVGSGPTDPDLRAAALALRRLGARRVVEFTGGMLEWRGLGFAEEKTPARAA